MEMPLVWVAGTVWLSDAEWGSSAGSVPVAVAVLSTLPSSISAWVTLYVPVHDRLSPGASVVGCAGAHESVPRSGSAMDTVVSVTLPSLLATSV